VSAEASEHSVEVEGRAQPYLLIRRRGRRRLTLSVEPRRGLVVLAPPRLALRDIEAFIRLEAAWWGSRLVELAAWEAAHPPRAFTSGERLPLLGEAWTLRVSEEPGRQRPRIAREARASGPGSIVLILPAGLAPGERRELAALSLGRWYRRLAGELIAARAAHWAADLRVAPTAISIRDTRSRWGSCSGSGRLSFSWKLAMAPPAVLDYLVVHELCHLVHHDHSERFWALVASRLPDYERARRWLRRHGQELYL
jgi:predicted metal-dependent hydrolase